MSAEERLAALYAQLAGFGLPCLVMGGHAVRFHGIDRTTVDFDFHIALEPEAWGGLLETLGRSPLLGGAREAHSWRPADFRRFVIGRLADGRDELLECWRRNHLLAPFPDLFARREEGLYGGATVAFLGLSDLIRSKETEREDDWRDVTLLEEIADERRLSAARGPEELTLALRELRSRRGFESARAAGLFSRSEVVASASRGPGHVLAAAFLSPWVKGEVKWPEMTAAPILEIGASLATVTPGSARHLALVEAVRRLYRRSAMAADRADKESASPPPAG
jgi:hypothetical protein